MEPMGVLSEGHRKATGRTTTRSGSGAKRFSIFLRRLKVAALRLTMLAITVGMYGLTSADLAYADGVKDSKLATGTEKLIGDVTTWLMILAPIVSGLLIIYFSIRRSAADEMDVKKWNNRIIVAIVSCIGAVLGSATLNIIIGYYK